MSLRSSYTGNTPIERTHRGEDDQCLYNRADVGGVSLTARQLHSLRDEHDGGWCGWMSENGYPITHPTDEV
ncbi:hypothetical protein HOLleu_42645 [Holothuria leucospilota]|uniref:Uncharacterized protein n=1 Tax=Holothuria leucospilota TaxID=206669 RepID=A0A9Q1BA15_HOLLE|nr:hypothetical protein HOLleu_42645 [Holothuria leucospilota]